MPPASRIGDNHVCPKVEPGPVPHVGGPILTGESTVLIGNKPAARVSDLAQCNAPPDSVKKGSSNVIISNQEAARIGDPTSHGGVVVQGEPTVLIGSGAQSGVMQSASRSGAPFCEECERRKREQQERDAAKRAASQGRARPPHQSQRASTATPAGAQRLGTLSAQYESGDRGPGTISHTRGDVGGASYGTHQIATRTGTMNEFMGYLQRNEPAMHAELAPHQPGTAGFDHAWRGIAERDPAGFERAQHDFIQQTHYAPALRGVERAVPGLDFDQRSGTLRDVLWSTSVQHGGGGATNVFRRALAGTDPAQLSDQEIIQRVYAERGAENGARYFSRSAPSVRASVVRRFGNEGREAQEMLLRERARA